MNTEVVVVRTGVANLASVFAGLRRAGGAPRMAETADDVRTAARAVLPGVGAFGAGSGELSRTGMADALRQRIDAGRPTLAVCLGLQLLGERSDETAGARGLGVFAGHAERFPDSVRVPQFGWNKIVSDADCRYLHTGYAYFANSFRLTTAPAGWGAARADHGGPFVAGLERGDVLACQFHPELSGAYGRELLERWVGGAPC